MCSTHHTSVVFLFCFFGHIYFSSLFRCTFKMFHHHPSDTASGAPVPLPQHSRVTQHQVLLSSTSAQQSDTASGLKADWTSLLTSSQRTSSNKKAVTHFPKTKMGECQNDFCNRVLVSAEKIKRSWLMYSNRNDSLHCFCC